MIQFNNVCKTYVSKRKHRVDALKNVSFELGNTGMVFILGKSGSGKSTLLNMLGGLDSPTSGEIVVDGVSMKDFKQSDYDGYRNGYVGFIFQEFNLLDDFNVKDNVALTLQLSRGKNIDGKVVEALRQVELPDEYLTRHVGEMSGGERQRVAIARSIVKDSKMILADEPTGNLDSVTGESIWKILKNLSKSKLVVVVSHDRESAEKYADRIIEIADGKVVSDNGAQSVEKEQTVPLTLTKKRLPFVACLKMGVNSLLQRKVKSIFIVLLSMFSIVILLIAEMALNISPERSLARFIKQNDIPYFMVGQGARVENRSGIQSIKMRRSTLNYLQQNSQCVVNGIVESKQDVLDFGLTFYGDALELDSNSFYINKYWWEDISKWRDRVEVDGEMVSIEEAGYPIEFLVGKRVDLSLLRVTDDNYPTLAGIIDTDAMGLYAYNNLPWYFAQQDFESRGANQYGSYNINTFDIGIFRLEYGDKSSSKNMHIEKLSSLHGNRLITADSKAGQDTVSYYDVTLADNEIVLNYSMYKELFDRVEDQYKYVDGSKILSVPSHLGQTFSLKLYDEESGDLIVDVGEFTLVGVAFDDYLYDCYIELSPQTLKELWPVLGTGAVCIRTDSVKHLESFLVKMRRSYEGIVWWAGVLLPVDNMDDYSTEVASFTYDFVENLTYFALIFGAIGTVLLLVLLFMVINLITFSVISRTRAIGILMGLGASKRDINKIFILEALVISVLSFVLALISIFALTAIFNAYFSSKYLLVVPLFCVEFLTIAVLFAISFGFVLFAAWLPLIRIAKLKPIDAIRNL